MIKLEMELSDIDYEVLVKEILPKVADRLRKNGSPLAPLLSGGMAANVLSKYLNVKSGRLLDEYHVRYENKVRHEGRRITLTYDAESK